MSSAFPRHIFFSAKYKWPTCKFIQPYWFAADIHLCRSSVQQRSWWSLFVRLLFYVRWRMYRSNGDTTIACVRHQRLPLSREQALSCHTFYDTGPRCLRSHPMSPPPPPPPLLGFFHKHLFFPQTHKEVNFFLIIFWKKLIFLGG